MRLPLLVGLVLLAPLLAGCSTSVSNGVDGQGAGGGGEGSFSKSANHAGATKTERVTWENGAARASGTFSANVGSGVVRAEMLDGAGAVVWTTSTSGVGQTSRAFTTEAGAPGTWALVVTVTAFTGQYAVVGGAA